MKWRARDYQEAMRRFALEHLQQHGKIRINLWAGVGTGKTSTALAIIDALFLFGEAQRVLVLATKKIALEVWGPEIEQWQDFRHLSYSIAVGGKADRHKALASGAKVVVINYDVLPAFIAECGENWPFDLVIADESSRLKTLRASTRTSSKGKTFAVVQGSARAKAIGKIAHTKIRHFINLTGSPAPNGLLDIYGPVWLLDAGRRLGRSYSAFLSRWFRQVPRGERFAYEPLPHAQDEIMAAIRDITLTIEASDYLDLPPLLESIVPVHLPPKAMQLYKEFEREAFLEIAGKEVEAFNPAALLSKSRQIASGAVYHEAGQFEVIHDAKIEALREEVENANGMPLLVAYQYVSEMQRILRAFPGAEVIADDPTTIKRWNKGEIPMLLGHPASMGHGLSLQWGSNILIDFSTGFDLELDEQVIGRINPTRQLQAGLNRTVYRRRLVAMGTVEEYVVKRVKTKESVQQMVRNAMKSLDLSFSRS